MQPFPGMRWLVVCWCVWVAGCTTEVVPVPGECEALVLQERVSVSLAPRVRILALIEPETPDEIRDGIDTAAEILRTGDVDADGEREFPPLKEVETVERVGALDGPLAPIVAAEVPTGWTADATLLMVVIAPASDITPSVVDEVDALVSVHDPRDTAFVGLTPCAAPAENLRLLLAELEDRHVDSLLIDACAESWEQDLPWIAVPRLGSWLGGACSPRDVDVLEDGRRACHVYETPLAESPFDCTLPGRVADPTADAPGRCRIVQRVADGAVPTEPGWYWDDFTDRSTSSCGEGGQTISYSGGVELAEGATVELMCVTQRGECGGT